MLALSECPPLIDFANFSSPSHALGITDDEGTDISLVGTILLCIGLEVFGRDIVVKLVTHLLSLTE